MSKAKKPESIRSHFVPQLYLKNFVGKDERIWVFDKVTAKTFVTTTRHIAVERDFYRLPELSTDLGIDPQFIEKEYLGNFENNFGRLLVDVERRLARKRSITTKQKAELALQLAVQWQRTRSQRDSYLELQEKVATELGKMKAKRAGINVDWDTTKIGVHPKFENLFHVGFLADPEVLADISRTFHAHIWTFFRNDTTIPFYTSDTPVSYRAHAVDARLGFGIGSQSVEMVFSLSPKYLLRMLERSYFTRVSHLDGKLIVLHDPKEVDYYNCFSINNSIRQIYSPTDQFELARFMLQENPALRKLNLERFTVSKLSFSNP